MSKFYGIYIRDGYSSDGVNPSEIIPFLFPTQDCALTFIESMDDALDFIVGIASHDEVEMRFGMELIIGYPHLSLACKKSTLFVAISNNINKHFEFLATGRTKKQCKESVNRILMDESHECFDVDEVGASVRKVSTEFLKCKKLTPSIADKLARSYVKSRFNVYGFFNAIISMVVRR